MNESFVKDLQTEFSNSEILETLKKLSKRYAGKIAFSTSFGQEDQVITDLISSHNIPIRVFTLDTGRLFQETYKVYNQTLNFYKKNIEVYFPDTLEVETMMTQKGPFSFYESVENRKECCNIRKVNPLHRALQGVEIWITGLRSGQSVARKELALFEFNSQNNLVKYNPLKDWTFQEVLDYLRKKTVPYNILHDKGFVSVGCAPCTRAIKEGEDIRSGRWWWEDQSKKECGLHIK